MKKRYFLFCSCGKKMKTQAPWLAVWFKAIHLDKGHDVTFYMVTLKE